ncbi:MAG: AAA family ATPase [Terrimicrobiaceae bacterium]|nr:AAA family ATPase [Terrimicrobiaceae bacterium]
MALSKESALEKLRLAQSAGRLAHAHLFTGPPGSGKMWLARSLAAHVLDCGADSVLAHPDLHLVQPESKSRRIVVEQIRQLEAAIHRKPLLGPAKAAILSDADRLQPAAANAFLKTLEEPPEGCVIILTSSLPEAILETILSRCIETALQGAELGLPSHAAPIIEAVEASLLSPGKPTIAAAFRLTRAFQAILAEIRENVAREHATLLKQEAARYKNIPDAASWLEEREAQLKALAESSALRERERLLGVVFLLLGGAARAAVGEPPPHPICQRLAERFSPAEIFEKIEAYETMRRRLALTVNEPLVLEAGFLEIVRGTRPQ